MQGGVVNQISGRVWTAIGGVALLLAGVGLATLGIAQLFPLVFEWSVRVFWFSAEGTAQSLTQTVWGFACLGGGIAILGGGWALLAKAFIAPVMQESTPASDDGLDVFSSLVPRDSDRADGPASRERRPGLDHGEVGS